MSDLEPGGATELPLQFSKGQGQIAQMTGHIQTHELSLPPSPSCFKLVQAD